MNVYLPLLSTVISLVFAAAVFSQWLSRRKVYQLVWTLGLLAFGISAGCEFVVGVWGLSDPVYRLWYLIGAVSVAAYLGVGTIYLLAPRRFAHTVMAMLVLAWLYAATRVVTVPVALDAVVGSAILTGAGMPNDVRLMTPVFNVFGTAALVGGAAYSAWIFWQRRIMPQRVVSNILIAIGAALPASGGTLLRFGIPDVFYLMEFLGVTIIFIGFLANSEIVALRMFPKPTPPASQA
ncbi:MAG: hypothetical protein HY675_10630 [Chloroflexi bacterium]|nr:hypothetical protein [Chloroflexota bacterium]